jgi:CRP/FNR family transcriptional regulator, anaerobic regulatory protein
MNARLRAEAAKRISHSMDSHRAIPGDAAAAGDPGTWWITNAILNVAPFALQETIQTAPARRIICREHDLLEGVPVVCKGWAASVVTLSDGRRQILSFLLPGDMVSTVLLFTSRPDSLVETITELRYCMFERSQLKSVLLQHPDAFERLASAWIEEKQRTDQLIVDLGRRTADERIARLILNLSERLARRGMTVEGETVEMEFPLRQHHIADATGLTPVHVSKVLTEFRRNGLIRISDRSLTILDQAGFRRVADMR